MNVDEAKEIIRKEPPHVVARATFATMVRVKASKVNKDDNGDVMCITSTWLNGDELIAVAEKILSDAAQSGQESQ